MLTAAAAAVVGPHGAWAGNFTLNANDASGTSSFTSPLTGAAGGWSSGAAPAAGNSYEVTGTSQNNYLLRSPADATSPTFAGDSLQLDSQARFILKGTGGNTITVGNLILNGGLVDLSGTTAATTETLAGGITLNNATLSTILAESGFTLNVSPSIGGSGNIDFGATSLTAGNNAITGIVGSGTVNLTAANAYTGTTTLGGGFLNLNGANGALAGTSGLSLFSGTLTLDNSSGTLNNLDRINDSAAIALSGGNFVLKGNATASTNSSETVGAISGLGGSTLTVAFGGTNTATLNAASLTHTLGNGSILLNGVGLGKDSTSTASVGRIIVGTAPTLIGNTAALSTGINSANKDTQIVPFLVGEATSTTGGVGTASGTADTFVTYNSGTGFRPLNPTDEFTQNAITAGTNTRITTATTTGATSASINSLLMNGANLTITDGTTLTVGSGAVLFASSNTVAPSTSTGALGFGANEGIVTAATGTTGTFTAPVTGTGGLTVGGPGTVTFSGTTTSLIAGVTGAISKFGSGTVNVNTTTASYLPSNSTNPINVQGGALQFTNSTGTTFTNPLGTGTITLTPGATLQLSLAGNTASTFGNSIVVANANPDGIAILKDNSGAVPFSGSLSFAAGSSIPTVQLQNTNGTAATLSIAGGVTGVGNIQLNATAGGAPITLQGTAVNNTGTIVNLGGGSSTATISAPVGSNVGSITEAGASPFTITGGITLGGDRVYAETSTGQFTLANITGTATAGSQTVTFNNTSTGLLQSGGVIADGTGGGKVAVSVIGTSTGLVGFSGASTYSGGTTLTAGSSTAVQTSSTGTAGSPTNGPFGTGLLTLAGGAIRASTTAGTYTVGNTVAVTGDTTFLSGGANTDQNLIFSGPVTLSGTRTFTVNTSPVAGATGVFFNGAVAGASGGGLTKAGLGTLVLAGANTYTGPTNVNAGVLELFNAASQPPSSFITVASGATLALGVGGTGQFTSFNVANTSFASGSFLGLDTTAAPGPTTISSNLSLGAGVNLNKTGAGTLILSGNNSYSGTTLVSSGILSAADGVGLPSASNLTINSAAVSTGNAATFAPATATFERPLGTAGGQMQITGGNSGFTSLLPSTTVDFGAGGTPAALTWGGTTFNPAALVLNDTGATGALTFSSPINFGTAARTVTVNSTAAGTAATLSGQLTAGTGGALTKAGAGQLNVTNVTNSYAGTTTVSAGTLSFNGGGSAAGSMPLPSASTVQINAGTFQVLNDSAGTLAYGNAVNLGGTQAISVGNNGGGTTGSTVAFGTLNAPATATNTATTTTINGSNGYGVSFNGATALNLPGSTGQGTTLVANTNVAINGNVVDRESGFGATNFDTLTLDGTATGNVITGVIADATGGSLTAGGVTKVTKQGAGTWTLTGTSTYVGATTVSAGTLALGNGGNLAGTAVTVGTATLAARPGVAGATNTIAGAVTLNSGAALSMADGVASTFKLTSATASTLAPASGTAPVLTFDLVGDASNAADQLALTTAPTVGAAGVKISINPVGTTAPTVTSFTVITAPSNLGTTAFTLSSSRVIYPSGAYNLSLSTSTANSEVVTLTASTTGVYFTGKADPTTLNASTNNGTTTNFSTDLAGNNDVGTTTLPSTADVFFTATSVTTPQTINSLGQSYTWNTLNYTPTAPAITINDSTGNTLTLNAGINVASGAAAQTVNVPITLGAAQTITNNSANTLTLGGGVTAAGNLLTFAGTGAGGVNITPGSGSSIFSTTTGGLTVASGGPVTISAPITLGGAATFTNNTANALTLGTTTLGSGTTGFALTVAGTGPTTFTGNVTGPTATTGVVTKTASGTLTFNGAANGFQTLNINNNSIVDIGSGVLTLSNGGGSTIQSSTGGTINATGGGAIKFGTSTTPNFADNGTASATTLTINAKITTNGLPAANDGFEVFNSSTGTGVVVLTNPNNDFTGDVNVDGGVLQVSSIGTTTGTPSTTPASPLGKGSQILLSNNASGTLRYVGTGETTNRIINLNGTTSGGVLDQSGTGLLKFTANFATPGAGAKTLTLQGSTAGIGEIDGIIPNSTVATNTTAITKAGTGTWILSGLNTYSGATAVNAGTLQLGSANGVGSLGTSAVTVAAGANLAFGNLAANSVPNTITGAGNVVQSGTGATTLTASNSYSGVTAVNAGLLFVNGNTAGQGTYSIASAATLGGTGTINLAGTSIVSVASGGTLAPGNGTAPGVLNVNGPTGGTSNVVTLASGSNFQEFLTHNGFSELLVSNGNIVLNGANLVLQQDGSLTGGETFTIIDPPGSITGTFANAPTGSGVSNGIPFTVGYNPSSITLTVGAVPEPASLGLLGVGALGLLARRRRRPVARA